MATNYEEFYKNNPHGLGKPFQEYVDFFNAYPKDKANVLDLGAGQGRDALFIARLGHAVTAVDMSKSGIDQLLDDAKKEGINITGVVEDIKRFAPQTSFDVIIIDRTLHMLEVESERLSVLETMSKYMNPGGYILIADEKKNLPSMKAMFADNYWKEVLNQKGFLFIQKSSG